MKRTILILSWLLLATSSKAAIFTVDDDGPADFRNIQAAINYSHDGYIIEVKPGTYTGPGNRDIDFLGKAITVRSQNGPENCIIDCEEVDRGFYFHNNEGANSVLAGFTITNGYSSGYGGGIYCRRSSPTIINCTISGNSAKNYGGGIYCRDSSPTITNCTINENQAQFGGGMCNSRSNPTITNCTISTNSAKYSGGGIYCRRDYGPPEMANSTIVGNAGTGIFYDNRHDDIIITNCTIADNTASYGGGVYCDRSSSPTLTNCTFSSNSSLSGGGICCSGSSPTITNCMFSGNSAGEGGGMRNRDSSPTLTNCTFSGNSAGNGGGMYNDNSNPTLANCILWGDMPQGIYVNPLSMPVITYSDVEGGWSGIGNIDADPCFVQPGYWDANGLWVDGDYHLLPDSPCIDTGDPNYIAGPNETDLDGKPRVIGGRIDMGAYEHRPTIPAEVRIVPRTINLASKGKWITCYIRLGEGYDVADIDSDSILLDGEIEPEQFLLNEQEQVVIIRFSRLDVQDILNIGQVELTISGQLMDGTVFEGTDAIRVIAKGGGKST